VGFLDGKIMKVRGTRKEKAIKLLNTITRGPSLLGYVVKSDNHPFDINPTRDYERWTNSWVIPYLYELIPELKAIKKAREAASKIASQDRPEAKAQGASDGLPRPNG
jgi:hypothetical protein